MILGVDKVMKSFDRKKKAIGDDKKPRADVGYAADHALLVHEDLGAYHAPPTQAKYLTGPAYRYRKQAAAEVRKALREGLTFRQAVLAGARFILKKSKEVVPVDTGELKRSGYARTTRWRNS